MLQFSLGWSSRSRSLCLNEFRLAPASGAGVPNASADFAQLVLTELQVVLEGPQDPGIYYFQLMPASDAPFSRNPGRFRIFAPHFFCRRHGAMRGKGPTLNSGSHQLLRTKGFGGVSKLCPSSFTIDTSSALNNEMYCCYIESQSAARAWNHA